MNIYGVIYQDKGKVYYFNGKDLDIANDVTVIVDTNRGEQFGKVVSKLSPEKLPKMEEELKEIIRVATKKDYDQYLKNCKDASLALKKAEEFSRELNLDMRFVKSSFTFDRKQLILNFYADDRVDFRELAKKLAGVYRTRIELRQIGARDKATIVGGVGMCGRQLCCSSILEHMDSVSINMAKDQNLSLNPSKINGCCGRLMCCLAYEEEMYLECSKGMPLIGDKVKINGTLGEVISVDILQRKYKVLVNDEVKEINLKDEKVA